MAARFAQQGMGLFAPRGLPAFSLFSLIRFLVLETQQNKCKGLRPAPISYRCGA
jgi:hypothetical protein